MSFLQRSFLFPLSTELSKLLGKKILHAELVLVGKVRDVHGGASGADPVGADWTGIPGSKPGRVFPLVTS